MIFFKFGLLVVIEKTIVVQLVNDYKLLNEWEPSVDIEVEVKYVILIFYFDIFIFRSLM